MQQNVSPYPTPPEYSLNYTNDNIRAGNIPKPPPVPSKFKIFNEEYTLDGPMMPALQDLEITKYYNSKEPWKSELKKLNFSVVAAFLDLLDILIKNPQHADRKEKIETIRTLFINMHHLINEHRPVQARETLVEMMKKQNKDLAGVIERLTLLLKNVKTKTVEVHKELEECKLDLIVPECSSSSLSPPEHKVMSYNIIQNRRLTDREIKRQEFKCREDALKKHMKLMKLAQEEKPEFTETFNDDDLVDNEENEAQELEKAESSGSESSEVNEDDFIEEEKSSDSEEEVVKDDVLEVAVEYMDDDEDDEDDDDDDLEDVMDDSEEEKNASSPQTEASADNNVGLEPPSEFVDDKRVDDPDAEMTMMAEDESQNFPLSPELDNNDSGDNSDQERQE
ncbi:unnamed protein product [Bursaphelenchus okinawaensis]|uniref:Mediator of RNA polymerase II transcription subunit 7 n=1 Tax=Bursaphelenchus okinawaensis TaxID=465554 RepID=A0A811L927_9BILA|nr:unnamed protein product [Bursaphelenchus okinawaensis]CAG9120243.1 unnamed protein product [Bursaphelenchus okinawaensis]